jgi:hypothetical protein
MFGRKKAATKEQVSAGEGHVVVGRKKATAKAKIIADEGYVMVDRNQRWTLQHHTYIIDVHPDGEEPFRTEVKAWVPWPGQPRAGHVLNVSYDQKSHEAELQIEGDPRYDWKPQEAQAKADAARQREQLLSEPPSKGPLH